MNRLRRGLLAGLGLLLALACAGVIVLAWTQDKKLDVAIGGWNLQALVDAGDLAKWLSTGVFGLLMAGGVAAFVVALWPDPAWGRGVLKVRRPDGTTYEVDATGVAEVLARRFGLLPDIVSADVIVRIDRGIVDTSLDVTIHPGASLANVTAALVHTTVRGLEEEFGVFGAPRPFVRVTYAQPDIAWDADRPDGLPAFTWPSNPEPPGPARGRLIFPGSQADDA